MPRQETLRRLHDRLVLTDPSMVPAFMYILRHGLHKETPSTVSPESWEAHLKNLADFFFANRSSSTFESSSTINTSLKVVGNNLKKRYYNHTGKQMPEFKRLGAEGPRKILEAVRDGASSDQEIMDATGLSYNTVRNNSRRMSTYHEYELRFPSLDRISLRKFQSLIVNERNKAWLQYVFDHLTEKRVKKLLNITPPTIAHMETVILQLPPLYRIHREQDYIKLLRAEYIPHIKLPSGVYVPQHFLEEINLALVVHQSQLNQPAKSKDKRYPLKNVEPAPSKPPTKEVRIMKKRRSGLRTAAEQADSFDTRLFTTNERLRSVLKIVIKHRLYLEVPSRISKKKWVRNLFITCMHYFGGVSTAELARRYTGKNREQLTQQRIRLIIFTTTDILYARYLKSDQRSVPLSRKKASLTGNSHKVALHMSRHPEHNNSQVLSDVIEKFDLHFHDLVQVNKDLEKVGIAGPGTSIGLERKKERKSILKSSTNTEKLRAALDKVGPNTLLEEKNLLLEDKCVLSIKEVTRKAGYSLNHRLTSQIVDYLITQSKVVGQEIPVKTLSVQLKKRDKQYKANYYLIPRSCLDQAVDIIKSMPGVETMGKRKIHIAIGQRTRELPTFTEFTKFPYLSKLLKRLGFISKYAYLQPFLDQLTDDCPAPIFKFSGQLRYHPDDEQTLIAYLQSGNFRKILKEKDL